MARHPLPLPASLETQGLNLEHPAADPSFWLLDPQIAFLNHGSFGACPIQVLACQHTLRAELERQPIRFFVRQLERRWDAARRQLARFLGAKAQDLVFVTNATSGVNTVLRSLRFRPGDELLVTDHEYNACRNALNFAARASGVRVIVARLPFPVRCPEEVIEAMLRRVTRRTRLALIDHVTSPTGLVLPIEPLVLALAGRGVEVLVDGAHAPGMLSLHLDRLGAAFYTGNCHKWLCAPKGAAFLHVRSDWQRSVRPLTISHGANSPRRDRSRFLLEFGWTGTGDPTPWLCVPEAIGWMAARLPGGWPAVRQHNRALTLAARRLLSNALEIELPCPDSMIGSVASLPLPRARRKQAVRSPLYLDPLQDRLLARWGIEVPIIPWPRPPHRVLRISAQLYNALPQYRRLGEALRELL